MIYRAVKLIKKGHSKHGTHFTYLRAQSSISRPRNVLKCATGLQKAEIKG